MSGRASRWARGRSGVWLAPWWLLVACADTGSGPVDVVDASPSDAAAVPVDAGVVVECQVGETQGCDCGNDTTGLRACVGGYFTGCNGCVTSPMQVSHCVKGHYEGSFEMSYTPGPAGICGLATLFGGGGSGVFAFDLEDDGLGEFATVGQGCVRARSESVDAGVVQAGAEVFAKGVEMKAELTGVVDCATGELQGELRGTYRSTSVCGLGLVEDDFFFKGPFTGTFDPDTQAFDEGQLILREPPVAVPLAGEPGGMGTWNAALVDAPSDAGMLGFGDGSVDCLDGVPFVDFELPPLSDAGVDAGAVLDAGP